MTKFTLQPYTTPASRYQCPRCKHRNKTFVRYINTETGEQLADHVGRCGRENSCGYHFKPRQYFERQGEGRKAQGANVFRPRRKKAPTASRPAQTHEYINTDAVNLTIGKYWRNNLVQYLIGRFGTDATLKLLQLYRIGTARHWNGATVFWQIDIDGRVRTGKVMLYDPASGSRVKKPFNHITWAHALLSPKSAFKLKQCLFGEHLLKEFPTKPVAIVESEKTAMIAAAHDDTRIWLACGSSTNLNPQLCKVLKGRRITLYPDLGAYDKWLIKARILEAKITRTRFNVSDLVERNASDTDRKNGLDIADFL